MSAEDEKRARQRAKWRRKYHRNIERHRAKAAARYARRRLREPERVRADERKRSRKKRLKMSRARHRAMLSANEVAVPRTLPWQCRDDVVAALALGIIERRFTIADLPTQAKREIAAHNRQFDHFKTVSLDAPIAGTELRRVDTIAADAFHF